MVLWRPERACVRRGGRSYYQRPKVMPWKSKRARICAKAGAPTNSGLKCRCTEVEVPRDTSAAAAAAEASG